MSYNSNNNNSSRKTTNDDDPVVAALANIAKLAEANCSIHDIADHVRALASTMPRVTTTNVISELRHDGMIRSVPQQQQDNDDDEQLIYNSVQLALDSILGVNNSANHAHERQVRNKHDITTGDRSAAGTGYGNDYDYRYEQQGPELRGTIAARGDVNWERERQGRKRPRNVGHDFNDSRNTGFDYHRGRGDRHSSDNSNTWDNGTSSHIKKQQHRLFQFSSGRDTFPSATRTYSGNFGPSSNSAPLPPPPPPPPHPCSQKNDNRERNIVRNNYQQERQIPQRRHEEYNNHGQLTHQEQRFTFADAEQILGPRPMNIPPHVHQENLRKLMEERSRGAAAAGATAIMPIQTKEKYHHSSRSDSARTHLKQQPYVRHPGGLEGIRQAAILPRDHPLPPPPPPPIESSRSVPYQRTTTDGTLQASATHDATELPPKQRASHQQGNLPSVRVRQHLQQQQQPPGISLKERRTLILTNIPSNVTEAALTRYLAFHQVAVVAVRMDHLPRDHGGSKNTNDGKTDDEFTTSSDGATVKNVIEKKNTIPKTITAHVQCGSHGQAMSVLRSPEPVLNNRFIRVRIDSVNLDDSKLEDAAPSVPPPPTFAPGTTMGGQVTTSTNNKLYCTPEAEARAMEAKITTAQRSQNQLQLNLLQQRETLLEKQLTMQKKMLTMAQEKEEKQANMKDILASQKKLTDVKQQILDLTTEVSSSSPLDGGGKEDDDSAKLRARLASLRAKASRLGITTEKHTSTGIRRPRTFALDRRSKVLHVKGLPQNSTEGEVRNHFATFGPVANVQVLKDGEAQISFDNRVHAEKAKEGGADFAGSTLAVTWHVVRPLSKGSSPSKSGAAFSDANSGPGHESQESHGGDHSDPYYDYDDLPDDTYNEDEVNLDEYEDIVDYEED